MDFKNHFHDLTHLAYYEYNKKVIALGTMFTNNDALLKIMTLIVFK